MGGPAAHGTRGALRRSRGVTARAVAIGLALMPLNILSLVACNYAQGWTTGNETLFINIVTVLFLGVLLNEVLKRRRPRWALGAGELLTIYAMLGVGTGLVSSLWDLGGSLAGTITYPFWFATPENRWKDLLWPTLPTWLTVRDLDVLAGFYVGGAEPYDPRVVRAWAGPAAWWAAIVGAMMWVCLCLNSIVRRRWEEEEKLPFPLVTLPVQLVEERFGLLHNRLFWVGVGVTVAIGVWNTLAGVVPSLPEIPTFYDYTGYVQNRRPWSFIRYCGLWWDPFAVGLCYLMPLDLTLSLLLFDLMWMGEYVMTGQFGWATSPWSGFPYGDQQAAGALIALLLSVLWLDRRYLAQVMRKAVGLRSALREDGEEALGYRAAVLGTLGGIAFLWWVLARAGMETWVIPALLGLYFVMSLVISRLRAQLGPPSNEIHASAMPYWMLLTFAGSRSMTPRTLGVLALLRPYLYEQRSHPSPVQLEALKMAEGGRMERRRLAMAMAVVVPVAVLCYFWAQLQLGYTLGLGTPKAHYWNLVVPRSIAEGLSDDLQYPSAPGVSNMSAMGFGMVFTMVLMWLKMRFQWWPLHPVGYPIALSWAIDSMKPALLITWVVKSMLLRYGGLRAHRRALPLFLGLLAGSATLIWLLRMMFVLLGMAR